ncbi:hypothetical protein HPP92_013884 [Vanilla planifolia]|uniref:non-specific serine/threonine protein kinase n=1 Tax=Vanilla planifolia TaxID=51239 RepID=A0A835QT40_VANPL|nr:hypothetical protein HPP92_013884 [Vanilla planifolia]
MGNCFSNSGKSPAPTEPSAATAASDMNLDPSTAPRSPSPTPPPTTKPIKPTPIGPVLGRLMEDVRHTYSIGKELGRGQFGVTHLCTNKATGQQFACKTIAKRKLTNAEDIEDVRREVQIMHHLTGQPNIVELKGAYEDKHSVHLVMELCAGGELFDRIIAKGHFSERAAASLLRTIVQIVHTCHSMGVMHRDLKPENFLLLSKAEDAPLKATDFGLSVFFKPGEVFRDIVGSAYYIAPEVLKRKYGPEVDIWSIGVMLYILLCGVPPFWSESEHGIFKAILEAPVDLKSDPWPSISDGAKDLVKKMLCKDPQKRLTAFEVLNHPWIKEAGEAPDTPLDNAVLNRLKQFRELNKFKQVALRVIAGCLSEEEIRGLKEMFKNMDSDNSGTITAEELRQGLLQQGTKLSEAEVKQLLEAADADGNGTIDYDEFITATMHLNRMDREEHLFTAFQYFDKDNSGYITKEELEQALKEKGFYETKDIKEIISEADETILLFMQDQQEARMQAVDGRINYEEFVAMMRKSSPEPANPKKRRDVVNFPVADGFRVGSDGDDCSAWRLGKEGGKWKTIVVKVHIKESLEVELVDSKGYWSYYKWKEKCRDKIAPCIKIDNEILFDLSIETFGLMKQSISPFEVCDLNSQDDIHQKSLAHESEESNVHATRNPASADITPATRIGSMSFTQETLPQSNLLPFSSDQFENWGDSAMVDNSPRTDTSTDVDTDDRNERALRRLAQNREAARKSRLRKKAYVQQLENSRLKLTQIEQELQRARQQVYAVLILASRSELHSIYVFVDLVISQEFLFQAQETSHIRQVEMANRLFGLIIERKAVVLSFLY